MVGGKGGWLVTDEAGLNRVGGKVECRAEPGWILLPLSRLCLNQHNIRPPQ